MRSEKEYLKEKKKYISSVLNNEPDIYALLTPSQNEWIQKYYEVYTTELFKKLRGSLRLEVSKEKMANLTKLKGEGIWEFAGMRDMKYKGAACCELGHPLRYVYRAINKTTGTSLLFGSTCVGDFFDLDTDGVKALTRIKDTMYNEIKDMLAIKQKNWFGLHTKYDCGLLGCVWGQLDKEGVSAIQEKKWIPIVENFIREGLPLPKSLIETIGESLNPIIEKQVRQNYVLLTNELMAGLETLKSSKVSVISKVFTDGSNGLEGRLLGLSNNDLEKMEHLKKNWDTCTIQGLRKNIPLWVDRERRLLKAQEYYKDRVQTPWVEFLKEDFKEEVERLPENIQAALMFMAMFDTDVPVVSSWTARSNQFKYSVKGVNYPLDILFRYDELFSLISKGSTLQAIMQLDNTVKQKQERLHLDPDAVIIEYLQNHLTVPKYNSVWGVPIAIDIVIKRGMNFAYMSQKQKDLVKKVYGAMVDIDEREKANKDSESLLDSVLESTSQSKEDTAETNSTYSLKDKPDIEMKMHRLRTEGIDDLDDKTLAIMDTILQKGTVSDRQMKYINDAYYSIILGEAPIKPKTPEKAMTGKTKLSDRPDIVSIIGILKEPTIYRGLSEVTKGIIDNVEKYNTITDKQAACLIKTAGYYE